MGKKVDFRGLWQQKGKRRHWRGVGQLESASAEMSALLPPPASVSVGSQCHCKESKFVFAAQVTTGASNLLLCSPKFSVVLLL